MKYLNDYTNEAITKLLEENGAFFAFSDDQFNEAKNPELSKEDYCHVFSGLIAPKNNAESVLIGLAEINKKGIEQDIAENGVINIIKRELNNHEAYYTRDLTSTIEALGAYNITKEQVLKVFKNKNTTLEDLNYKFNN